MNAITSFSNPDFQTLTVWKDDSGREFYRAIDACANLRHSNPGQALSRHVDPEYIVQIDDGTNRAGLTNYLSEPGLYQLIFASRTEWAKKFQRWVFEDVLPKLRAEGGYIMPTATQQQLEAFQQTIIDQQQRIKSLEQSSLTQDKVASMYWQQILKSRKGQRVDKPTFTHMFAHLPKFLSSFGFSLHFTKSDLSCDERLFRKVELDKLRSSKLRREIIKEWNREKIENARFEGQEEWIIDLGYISLSCYFEGNVQDFLSLVFELSDRSDIQTWWNGLSHS